MRYKVGIMMCFLLFGLEACMDEKCDCLPEEGIAFMMKDVAYLFEGNEAIGYRPYYTLTDRLDILAFQNSQRDTTFSFDYAYCKEHPVIPVKLTPGKYQFLFVANLLDEKAMSWKSTSGEGLTATFRILENREPAVYLAAIRTADLWTISQLPVQLRMLVSRLEMKVVNPPEWITGLEFRVEHIAGKIIIEEAVSAENFQLGEELQDTTFVYKSEKLNYPGPGEYWMGMNTFPTYENFPALVDIKLKGENRLNQLVIDDRRLSFRSGRITRVSLEFTTENTVSVSVEINGKWEVIDEGEIEI